MYNKSLFKFSLLASALSLIACGSSDNDTPEPINLAPTVTAENITGSEKLVLSVPATAIDEDGNIATYQWQVTSDHDLTLTNDKTSEVSFKAPSVGLEGDTVELSITVTDNDGASATQAVSVTVKPITSEIVLKGLVTDSPLANANLEMYVQGREEAITGLTNADGNYSFDLTLDDDEADLITIIAKGTGTQDNAGLISVIEGIQDVSAEGTPISHTVSNITTAQYALAKRANDNQEITDKANYKHHYSQLNANEVLTLATAIKVAIDKSGDNPNLALPEGIEDTLALVNKEEATSSYVQSIINTPEFSEAQNEIFNDDKLTDRSILNVPEAYYELARPLIGGSIYRFNDNGTGFIPGYYDDEPEKEFTWNLTDGVINLTMTAGNTITYVEYLEINGEWKDVNVLRQEVSRKLTRLTSTSGNDTFKVLSIVTLEYPNGEFPSSSISNEYITSLTIGNHKDIDAINSGVAYLPIPSSYTETSEVNMDVSAEKVTLNTDKTCQIFIGQEACSWSIINGRLELKFDDQSYSQFENIHSSPEADQLIMHHFEAGSAIGKSKRLGFGKVLPAQLSWKAEMVPGIYTYDNSAFENPLQKYWLELGANGNAETISTYDRNGDGQLDPDTEISIQYGRWSIDSEGRLVITRMTGVRSPDCRETNTETGCLLYNTRKWELIGHTSSEFAVFHKHHWHDSLRHTNNKDRVTYDTRILFKVEQQPITVDIPR